MYVLNFLIDLPHTYLRLLNFILTLLYYVSDLLEYFRLYYVLQLFREGMVLPYGDWYFRVAGFETGALDTELLQETLELLEDTFQY